MHLFSLILGYKNLNRGQTYSSSHQDLILKNQTWLFNNIEKLVDKFEVISFDNLALDQLQVKRFLTENEWNEFYMGDDGTSTYYIDSVAHKFSKNSVAPLNERFDLLDSVDDMFKFIRGNN